MPSLFYLAMQQHPCSLVSSVPIESHLCVFTVDALGAGYGHTHLL